jgi:hypothetical protein
MAVISVSLPSDGQTIDVADYNTPITTIVNEINGNLDNANIKSAAAIAGSKLADNGITTAKIADANVTAAKVAAGIPINFSYAGLATSGTTSNVIPGDNTIPQIGEGTELVTLVFTPKSATSTLIIQAQVMLITAGTTYAGVAALFVDATANALGADAVNGDQGGPSIARPFAVVASGSTTARTYRLRVGPSSAGTVRWNGSGGQWFSTVEKTCITVTEVQG